MDKKKYLEILHNPEEKIQDVLEESFAAAAIQGRVSETAMVLSDRRLYLLGKVYMLDENELPYLYSTDETIFVKDIINTKIHKSKPSWVLMLIIAYIFIALIVMVFALFLESKFFMWVSGMVVLIGAMHGLYYLLKRQYYFHVEYARGGRGGILAVPIKPYAPEKAIEFEKQISIVRDTLLAGKIKTR
ncbi:MAG: hypothetical protein KAR42_07575 [candidate division Zixibacteria bacterium]|nr:hypothetical protein [candidate division Zixibacteria bacterium]